MNLGLKRRKQFTSAITLLVVFVCMLQAGCGPEDYQKPIQQFQDASNVVINSTRIFLNNMNLIEQNAQLDTTVFEKKPLDLPMLNKVQIISPEEIKIRTDALDALAQYTSNLAELAQGKSETAVGDSTTKLSASIKTLADDAKKIPGGFFDNAKFSGVASAAAVAIGAVAQLIVQHKARHEIEKSIAANDATITALINHIGDEAAGSYLRQQAQLGAYGVQLSRDYEIELRGSPDPILLLSFASRIKSYRTQQSQLSQANPAAAIDKMRKAHEALVSYAKSKKTPKSLSELIAAAQDFANAAQPLGQAVQGLISSAM
jgi:hypothetical protein